MKVLVVDDQRSARRVLRQILGGLEDVEILEAGIWPRPSPRSKAQRRICSSRHPSLRRSARSRRARDSAAVRAAGRNTPAVIITTSSELAEIREAMRHGAQDYVLKDELSPEMLLPIVEGIRESA